MAIDLPEIQSLDPREGVAAKADEAWRRVGRPLVVEETGLEIEAFGGFPGPLVKWMLDAMGAEGLARAVIATAAASPAGEEGPPRAVARCVLACVDGDRRVTGEGVDPGHLVAPPRGDRGFGWAPVFVPEGEERTYAELDDEEKERRGHRVARPGAAARRLSTGPGGRPAARQIRAEDVICRRPAIPTMPRAPDAAPSASAARGGIEASRLADQLDRVLERERASRLHVAITNLPPKMRRALVLFLRGFKYREIAILMNVSIETIKSQLHQAKARLRDALGEDLL